MNDVGEDENAILGAPLSEMLWKPLNYGDFPIHMIPESLQSPRNSNVETLIISGSVDFSTPPCFATKFLPYLKNGKQIILSEFGHVGDLRYLRQSMSDRIITDYFNLGKVDEFKIEYVPMDFQVSWGFPLIFKVVIGVVVTIVIVLIVLIIWFIRKIKRKKIINISNI